MERVDSKNFSNLFLKIEKEIEECDFIGIDCEFSGLTCSDENIISFLDEADTNYQKQVKNVANLQILQIGLSLAKYSQNMNTYNITTYSISLFPSQYADYSPRFTFQIGALKFLSHHNFDFNNAFYNGVPFMSIEKYNFYKDLLDEYLKNPSQIYHLFLDYYSKIWYDRIKANIEEWLESKEEKSLQIEIPNTSSQSATCILMLIARDFNKKIFPSYADGKVNLSKQNSDLFKSKEFKNQLNMLLDNCFGFTRVIQKIIDSKKPIVGHNMYLDILFIFEKFICSPPDLYSDYKSSLCRYFDVLIDTKHLVRLDLENDKSLLKGIEDTSLSGLLKFLEMLVKSENNSLAPNILCSPSDNQNYHDAGFDSFATCSAFIHILHLSQEKNIKKIDAMISFKSLVNLMNDQVSCVNIVGSKCSYMNLKGQDGVRDYSKIVEKVVTLPSSDSKQHTIAKALLDNFHFKHSVAKSKYIYRVTANERSMELLQSRLKKYKTQFSDPPKIWLGNKNLFIGIVFVVGLLSSRYFWYKN